MAHSVRLTGLTLSIVKGAAVLIGRLSTQHVQRVPELLRSHLVGYVAQLPHDLAIADLIAELRTKLPVVALLVYRIRSSADHCDSFVRRSYEIVPGQIAFTRL